MTSTRSRFVDFAPNDSTVSLRQSDIDIFLLLQEFPYLALPFVAELLGHEKKTYSQGGKQIARYPVLRARLARLRKDGGYLKCPEQSWQAANSRYKPAVYALNANGFTVNLSADSLEEADELADTNCGPVTVVVSSDQMTNTHTAAGRTVVICPARVRNDMTCATCGICAAQRKAIIGFPALGPKKAVKL